jgi:hypothetical protein
MRQQKYLVSELCIISSRLVPTRNDSFHDLSAYSASMGS